MLPDATGNPVTVELLPALSVAGGKLLSRASHGRAVYAATFIRERRIVVELELLQNSQLFRVILLHELFHFVWVRLGNARRASFAALLTQEQASRARGHLGESSGLAKAAAKLPAGPGWRFYLCEAFCDTAAYFLAGSTAGQATPLANRWLNARRTWFALAASAGWRL